MKRILFLFCLALQLAGCASKYSTGLIKKEIQLNKGPAYLNDLFQDKDVEVKLKYKSTVQGKFENATKEHIIINTPSEVKYININQINAIIIDKKQTSLDWLIMALGSTGALIGGAGNNPTNDSDQNNLSNILSSTQGTIIGAMVGGTIGALTGFIINRSASKIQQIEYSTSFSNVVKTKAYNADQLIQTWDFMGVKFPIKVAKIKKLLALSKLVILDDSIGDEIDAQENKKYKLFPNISNFYEAYIFKLTMPKTRKSKYFTIIITTSNTAKFKMLNNKDILKMKSNIN